jgi:hypothetical protein
MPGRTRESSAAEDRRLLMKDVEPERGKCKAKDFTRRDVHKIPDGIVARNDPLAAAPENRDLSWVSQI